MDATYVGYGVWRVSFGCGHYATMNHRPKAATCPVCAYLAAQAAKDGAR